MFEKSNRHTQITSIKMEIGIEPNIHQKQCTHIFFRF